MTFRKIFNFADDEDNYFAVMRNNKKVDYLLKWVVNHLG